jgi:hypothetical protein
MYYLKGMIKPELETRKYKIIKVEDYTNAINKNIESLEEIEKMIKKSSKEIEKIIANFKEEFKEYIPKLDSCKELLSNFEKIKYEIKDREEEIIDIKKKQIIELEKSKVKVKTKVDDLYFNKKACHDYQYYIDVEQVNNRYNRFILAICQDKEIKLSIEIKDKRISGKYRVFFYLSDFHITVDVFDLIRREWLTSDDLRHERQIMMEKNQTLPFNYVFDLYGVRTLIK